MMKYISKHSPNFLSFPNGPKSATPAVGSLKGRSVKIIYYGWQKLGQLVTVFGSQLWSSKLAICDRVYEEPEEEEEAPSEKLIHKKGDCENGKGEIEFTNGIHVEGEFRNGHFIKGNIFHSEPVFEVEGCFSFDDYGQLEGVGKIIHLLDNSTEEGTFNHGRLNGRGKIIHFDRTVEEGMFENGKLNGQGKITHFDGSTEEGNFQEGALSGQGKMTEIFEGEIQEGTFKYGKLNGEGKITYLDGRMTKEGTFEQGQLHGFGKVTFANQLKVEGTFEGSYSNSHLINGTRTSSDGTLLTLKGFFSIEKIDGNGIILYPDGRIEEGIFVDGQCIVIP